MYTTYKQIQLLKFSHFHRTTEKHSSYPNKETLSFVLLRCMHYALSNPSCISVCLQMPHCKWSVRMLMVLRTVGAGLPCKQQTAVLTIPHSPLIRFKTALSPAVLFHTYQMTSLQNLIESNFPTCHEKISNSDSQNDKKLIVANTTEM